MIGYSKIPDKMMLDRLDLDHMFPIWIAILRSPMVSSVSGKPIMNILPPAVQSSVLRAFRLRVCELNQTPSVRQFYVTDQMNAQGANTKLVCMKTALNIKYRIATVFVNAICKEEIQTKRKARSTKKNIASSTWPRHFSHHTTTRSAVPLPGPLTLGTSLQGKTNKLEFHSWTKGNIGNKNKHWLQRTSARSAHDPAVVSGFQLHRGLTCQQWGVQ